MRRSRRHAKREGVILMVVLALLTLFAIVGLTFVAYGDKEVQANDNWLRQANELLQQVRQSASVIERDLLESLAGDLDFSASHEDLDVLDGKAEDFRDDVCTARDAEQDPAVRRRIARLCVTLEALVDAINRLQCLINLIDQSPNEQPA